MGNYLRTYRKRSGLSQLDVGLLLGYRTKAQVSRHERARTQPPLVIALAYEVIFHAPVSALFAQAHANARRSVDKKLVAFEIRLNGTGRVKRATAQKKAWLTEHRTL